MLSWMGSLKILKLLTAFGRKNLTLMFLSGVIDGVRCSSRDLFLEPLPTSGHRVVCCSAYFDLEGGLPTENAADSDFIYLSRVFGEILVQKDYS